MRKKFRATTVLNIFDLVNYVIFLKTSFSLRFRFLLHFYRTLSILCEFKRFY